METKIQSLDSYNLFILSWVFPAKPPYLFNKQQAECYDEGEEETAPPACREEGEGERPANPYSTVKLRVTWPGKRY